MIKVRLDGARGNDWNIPSVEVEMPTVPRIGERVAHESSGIEGTVWDVSYLWSESGEFIITVTAR